MKKIFLITSLLCALLTPMMIKAQDEAEEQVLKKDYHFKSAKPLTQMESLYTSVIAATPNGVQNAIGLELIAGKKNTNTFALIVANENYKNVGNVASALHDGQTFAEYCEKTFGIPKSQITFLTDATFGHVLPDDASKEAYLLLVDAHPQSSRTMIRLQEVYDGIGKLPNVALYAFMDACFSGSYRETGQKDTPVVPTLGIVLKHRGIEPGGNVFVLSAADTRQTAFPYAEKDHGMFNTGF